MRNFSDFNIKVEMGAFTGNKVKVSKILNRRITVHTYKIGPSKHFSGECLQLQIEYDGQKHVCFSGSTKLKEQIRMVPENGFPFSATIIEENDMHLFT